MHRAPPPLQVREQHTVAEIRMWFDEADADHDNTVSINEFFRWTLTKGVLYHGGIPGIQGVFQAYDKDNTGSLDLSEFSAAADDMGFGARRRRAAVRGDVPNAAERGRLERPVRREHCAR